MNNSPRARRNGMLTRAVGAELVVHDQDRQQLHTLNATAAIVWQHCDGRRTVADLAALLAHELNVVPDEGPVRLALEQLEDANLLDEGPRPAVVGDGIARRTFFKRAAAVVGGALLTPVVTSFGAPAHAKGPSKVLICHKGRTIAVGEDDVQEHLDQGDSVGPCGSATTAPPTTSMPTTSIPTTESPTTSPPTTVTPTTVTPTTSTPTTSTPTTSTPTTLTPTTSTPTTPTPTTSTPTTSTPTTSTPTTSTP